MDFEKCGGIKKFVKHFEYCEDSKNKMKEFLKSFIDQIKTKKEQQTEAEKKLVAILESEQGKNKKGEEKKGIDSFVNLLVRVGEHRTKNETAVR